MNYYPKIGSVSEGTLRTEDLLDTFAGELSYHMKHMRLARGQRKRFTQILHDLASVDRPQDNDEEYTTDLVNDLQDALNDIAPPYSYFGTTEGDGACFGFWPIINDNELPHVEEYTREHWGEDVLLVNDHGNVTCGHVDKRGKFHEYWSCV